MISALLWLAAINVACFLPHYLLNYRERPNPFEFLKPSHASDNRGIKLLYSKLPFSDPFRINFDVTVCVLVAGYLGWQGDVARVVLAGVLWFGFIEITYTSVMQAVFKRPPVLGSDLALITAGVTIVRGRLTGIVAGLLLALGLLAWASFSVMGALLAAMPTGNVLLLIAAVALVPPCLYNLRRYPYQKVIYRTVYSPALHLARNLEVGRSYQRMINEDAEHFAAQNRFGGLTLRGAPNVVFVCIESYGSVVYSQPALRTRLAPAIERLDTQRKATGLHVASAMSEAPLFTGGSWLSYTTFTYGLRIDNLVLYDRLFAPDSAFAAYESVFHVLRRNGYRNHLLGPLGGVAAHDVDWDRIQRNFQADVMIDFDGLDYAGPTLPYMGLAHRFAPPDQYALNAAYERASAGDTPFSLFFLTLNSHYPFDAPAAKRDDWRTLNDANLQLEVDGTADADTTSRYVAAMQYELDVVADFVAEHAADDTLFVVFGDHQPPFVATDDMGVATPVHILSRDAELVAQFVEGGYAEGLAPDTAKTTRHEDFMPLFLNAMAHRYGHAPNENS